MFGIFKKKEPSTEVMVAEELATLQKEERQQQKLPTAEDVKGIIPLISQAPYELKIKQVSLGLEIRLIRNNEKRLWRRQARAKSSVEQADTRRRGIINTLKLHRGELSVEARATNLARAFLKGKSYSTVENKCHEGNKPPMLRALEIAQKWGEGDKRTLAQAFERWDQEAMAYWEAHKIPPLTHAHQGQRHLLRLLRRGEQQSLTPEERRAHWQAYRDQKVFP